MKQHRTEPGAARQASAETLSPPQAHSQRLLHACLTLLCSIAAALPVIVSAARALADEWMPAGDQGIIATRAYDVFSAHTPLVGQYSLISEVTGHLTYSPGPLLYWLIALPARFGSPHTIALMIALANALAIVAIVALARARGGVVLMLATALAVALMCRSFMPEALHDPWNPSAGLLPFALLVFLCWSVACGERRLLPAVALLASFAAQSQVTFLAPTVGLVVVALAGLALSRRSTPTGRLWPWVLAAAVILAACWTPPVIDQLEHSTGNLTLLYRAATHHSSTLGSSAGARAVIRAVGLAPRWLRLPGDPFDTRLSDVTTTPSGLATVSTLIALAGLLAAALIGAWRRRADIAAAGLIGLLLCAGFYAVAASTPSGSVKVLGYTLWWGSVAGMWAWLTLAWSLYRLLATAVRLAWPAAITRVRSACSLVAVRLPAAGAAIAALYAAALAVALGQPHDAHSSEYRPISSLSSQFEQARLPPRRSTIWLRSTLGGVASPLSQAIKFLLRRKDLRILQDGAKARLGPWYELDHRRYDYIVYAYDGAAPDRRARIIARVTMSESRPPYPGAPTRPGSRTVTVSVARASLRRR